MSLLPDTDEFTVVLPDIPWPTYEFLLREFAGCRLPHFTYPRGYLELETCLTLRHETTRRAVEPVVETIAEEWERDIEPVGSITFRRRETGSGFEPDSAFYIQNAEAVGGLGRLTSARAIRRRTW